MHSIRITYVISIVVVTEPSLSTLNGTFPSMLYVTIPLLPESASYALNYKKRDTNAFIKLVIIVNEVST